MKRLYIGVGLLIVILASGILLTVVFSALHRPLAETLNNAAEAALAEDWAHAESQAAAARAEWTRLRHFSAAVTDHEPLVEMDSLFAQLTVLSGAKDAQEFAVVCRQLAARASTLADSQKISWWNLL